jgi:muramidase (phage lysozyme)
MSQFNSARRRGNYAVAGRAAANDALSLFLTARQSSPDYGRLAREAAVIRSAEKKAAIKASAYLAKTAVGVRSDLKAKQIKVDADTYVKKMTRKAGAISAAGDYALYGAMKQSEKSGERRDGSEYKDYFDKEEAKIRAEIEKHKNGIPTISTDTDGNNTGDQQGIDSAGKALEVPTASKVPKVSTVTPAPEIATASTVQSSSPVSSDGWPRLRRVLSFGEGTQGEKGYTTRFGGGQFKLGNDHPRIASRTPWGTESAAAGKYQIMPKTWDTVVQPNLNLPDFSIDSQEKAGRFLTKNRGVDPDKVITSYEEFEEVMNKLAPEWASLPYSKRSPTGFGMGSSYYGQGGKSLPELWEVYNQ